MMPEGDKGDPIDVDVQASEDERRRHQELHNKWTGKIWNGKQSEQIVLSDRMIQRIEGHDQGEDFEKPCYTYFGHIR